MRENSKRTFVSFGNLPAAFSFFLGLFFSVPALAGGSHSVMAVSATVPENCSAGVSPMVFASGDKADVSSARGSANIKVGCSADTFFNVTIDHGAHANGSQRRLASDDGRFLNYQVYSDAAHSNVWGGSGKAIAQRASGANIQQITAYAQIDHGNGSDGSGNYTDTLTISVNF